jgi:predicted HTH transcriptional regulator
MENQRYRTLSIRAKHLLEGEEGFDVEFKKSLADVSNEDLVAFANSVAGGTILIGIEEYKASGGRQRGRIIGCSIGDKEKIGIINRAESCIPPIEIDVFVENTNHRPFFRIEISSGGNKPYCTSGGTYKTRGDGRKIPLLPSRLLTMFMESESRDFLNRFRSATTELEKRLNEIMVRLEEVHEAVDFVSSDVVDAQSSTDEATSLAEHAASMTEELDASNNALHEKLDALLNHFDIVNPDIAIQQAQVKYLEEIFSDMVKKPKSKRKAG